MVTPRVVFVCAVLAAGSAFAQNASGLGLSWLLKQQAPDGSFGASTSEEPILATSEALAALRAFGWGGSSEARAAETFLALEHPEELDLFARRLIALSPGPLRDVDGEELLRLACAGPTAETRCGFGPGHTSAHAAEAALTLRALAPASADLGIRYAAQPLGLALLGLAGADGYAWLEHDPDAWLTGLAIEALSPLRFLPRFPGPLDRFIREQFLVKQQASGQFGTGVDALVATAQGLLALQGLDQAGFSEDVGMVASRASAFLTGAQRNDGSWSDSVYATSIALRALASRRPNWTVDTDEAGRALISFSNPQPIRGETVSLRLFFSNRSAQEAPSTELGLTALPEGGGAAVALGSYPISSLAAGARTETMVTFATGLLSGRYTIVAALDPLDLQLELSETDNVATGVLNVVRSINLSVHNTSISFEAAGATQLQVVVEISNFGEAIGQPFDVAFFRGNPDASGASLGRVVVPGIASGTRLTARQFVSSAGCISATPFYVVVDAANEIAEAREDDNRAFRFFFPESSSEVTDLAVSATGIKTMPAPPILKQPFQLLVQVQNLSGSDARWVPISVYSGGRLYGAAEVEFVPAHGSATSAIGLGVDLENSRYPCDLRVVVDESRRLVDPERDNNVAGLQACPAPIANDLVLSELSRPGLGQNRVSASLSQAGSTCAAADVAFYRGDVLLGGAQEVGRQKVQLCPGSLLHMMSPALVFSAGDLISACIDPDRHLSDVNWSNNCRSARAIAAGHAQFSVALEDVHIDPLGVEVGETFNTEAVVRNAGPSAGSAVVRLWQGRPTAADRRLLGQVQVDLAAGTQKTLHWRAVRGNGDTNLWVSIDDVSPSDSYGHDNLVFRNLFLKTAVTQRFPGRSLSKWQVVGDLFRTGHPAIVYDEEIGQEYATKTPPEARITAIQIHPDGSYSQQWSTVVAKGVYDASLPTRAWTYGSTLVDLENDGSPEVVVPVGTGKGRDHVMRLVALAADGSVKWRSPEVYLDFVGEKNKLGLGDLNGDSVVDIVFSWKSIVAFDGRDGSILFDIPSNYHAITSFVTVGDFDDDQRPEMVINDGLSLRDASGNPDWVQPFAGPFWAEVFAPVDVDLDGMPELAAPMFRGEMRVFDLARNQLKWRSQHLDLSNVSVAAGAARQDGLTYLFAASNSTTNYTVGVRPTSELMWKTPMAGSGWVSMADLYGLGRPQLLLNSQLDRLTIQDSRDGKLLFASHTASRHLALWAPPIVADVDGDGSGDVVSSLSDSWYSSAPVPPDYGYIEHERFSFLVFSSTHWARMPRVWNHPAYVRGQVDEDLQFQHGFKPWIQGNTFMQQYQDEPARLLPDLEVASREIIATPGQLIAGEQSTLAATIRNVGGLVAQNVSVEFFDGNPEQQGRFIGKAVAAGPLGIRGGVATVSVPWTAYPEGEHAIYVLVNPDKDVEESGYEANTAFERFLVRPGTQLCDLAVVPNSLEVTPPAPVSGTGATFVAQVRNGGTRGCAAAEVALWDGVPGEGSTLLGRATIPELAPDTAVLVEVPVGFGPGGHYLFVVADSAEVTLDGDRSNNTGTMTLTSPVGDQPDLRIIADASVAIPAVVIEGAEVTVAATLRNDGAAAANPLVRFYVGDSASTERLLGEQRLPGLVGPGQSMTTSFSLATSGWVGSHPVRVIVDPANEFAETNELNNEHVIEVTVLRADASLSVSAAEADYRANGVLTATATVVNEAGTGRGLVLEWFIERPDGSVVATLPAQERVLGAGESAVFVSQWNVGRHPPGAYRVRVALREDSRQLRQAAVIFSILEDHRLSTRLTLDQPSYLPGEEALIEQVVANDSLNAPSGPLYLVLTVGDPELPLLRSQRLISSLSRGASSKVLDLMPISPFTQQGEIPVELAVDDAAGARISVNRATLAVAQTPVALGLQMTVEAVPVEFSPGQRVTFRARTLNSGNSAVEDLLVLIIRDAETLATENVVVRPILVDPGARTDVEMSWDSPVGLGLGEKLVTFELAGRVLERVLLRAIEPSDTDPPTLTVAGIADGEVTRGPVTITLSGSDASTFLLTATLDGDPYQSGDPVDNEGEHELVATAVDAYDNQVRVVIRFELDRHPPLVMLDGMGEGGCTNQAVAPIHVLASDLNLDAARLLSNGALVTAADDLNGTTFSHVIDLSEEADYVLALAAEDAAGNIANASRAFCIDRTPPTLLVEAPQHGEVRSEDVRVAFSAADRHLLGVSGMLAFEGNRVPIASGSWLVAEGRYELEVLAADRAANQAEWRSEFAIDRTAPSIQILGLVDGEVAASRRAPTFNAEDPNLLSLEAELSNGTTAIPFASGTTIEEEGNYLLVVRAVDRAGNSASREARFRIDTTPPSIVVSGVAEGEVRATPIVAIWQVEDPNLLRSSALLHDGQREQAIGSGTAIENEGEYLLRIDALDEAGNHAAHEVRFSLDRTNPDVAIGGFEAGGCYSSAVTADAVVRDRHLSSWIATLDGKALNLPAAVASEGEHQLVVHASDGAGNAAVASATFVIDSQRPSIEVRGVAEGGLYTTAVTPDVRVGDDHLVVTHATLDGEPFAAGTPVEASGEHVLVVEANDCAGNRAELALRFDIARLGLSATLDDAAPVLIGHCGRKHPCLSPTPVLSAALAHNGLREEWAPTATEFIESLRSNRHRLFVVFRPDSGALSGADELIEQVFEGASLLLVLTDPPARPRLEAALGLQVLGLLPDAGWARISGLDGPQGVALAGNAVGLRPEGASSFAMVSRGKSSIVVGATHQIGRGRAATLAFDPEAAPSRAMEELVTSVLSMLAKPAPAQLLEGSPKLVRLEVSNDSGTVARVRLEAALHPEATWLGAQPLPEALNPPVWQFFVPGHETESVEVEVVLPGVANDALLRGQLQFWARGTWRPLVEISVPLPAIVPFEALIEEAYERLLSIRAAGRDEALVRQALGIISQLPAQPPATRSELDAVIAMVLQAIEPIERMTGAEAIEARLALDGLLRFYELRWANLR